MAPAAAVEIHPRTEPITDIFHFGKICGACGEERGLGPAQSGELPTGARGTTAYSRIISPELLEELLRLDNLDLEEEQTHDCYREGQRHNKVALHSCFLVNQQYELRER
jgi:hypothetical protein